MPLLTRLYGPEEFGVFTLYFSLVTILSVCLTLRMEQTVVTAQSLTSAVKKTKGIALQIFVLMAAVYVVVLPGTFDSTIPGISPLYILLIPGVASASALIVVLVSLLLWEERYKVIAVSKLLNAITYVVVAVLAGYYADDGNRINGLILGWSSAQATLLIILYLVLSRNRPGIWPSVDWTLYEGNKDVVTFNFPSTLADQASQQVPSLSISRLYDVEDVGTYGMAGRLLAAPISLIGAAISQVLFKHTAEAFNHRVSIVKPIYQSAALLFVVAVSVGAILWTMTPSAFALIFGDEWGHLANVVKILLPAFLLNLMVSPLSSVLISIRKLRPLAGWQVAFLIVTIGMFWMVEQPFIEKLKLFAIGQCIMYFLYLVLIASCVRNYEFDVNPRS